MTARWQCDIALAWLATVPQAIFTKARLYFALFQQHSTPLSVHRHNGVSAVQRAEGGLLVGAEGD